MNNNNVSRKSHLMFSHGLDERLHLCWNISVTEQIRDGGDVIEITAAGSKFFFKTKKKCALTRP